MWKVKVSVPVAVSVKGLTAQATSDTTRGYRLTIYSRDIRISGDLVCKLFNGVFFVYFKFEKLKFYYKILSSDLYFFRQWEF